MAENTSKPTNVVIVHQPPRPSEHVHRWAWCQRIDGAEIQRCYDCGRVRRG